MSEEQQEQPTPEETPKDPRFAFDDILVTVGEVRVGFEFIGEGRNGDWNPDDPKDEPLLRFYVERHVDDPNKIVDWVYVEDSSYCTSINKNNTNVATLVAYLMMIYTHVAEDVRKGVSIKRKCERLSWLGSAEGLA